MLGVTLLILEDMSAGRKGPDHWMLFDDRLPVWTGFGIWGWLQAWLLQLERGPRLLWVCAWVGLPTLIVSTSEGDSKFWAIVLVAGVQTLCLSANRANCGFWICGALLAGVLSIVGLTISADAVRWLIANVPIPAPIAAGLNSGLLPVCGWVALYLFTQGLLLSFAMPRRAPELSLWWHFGRKRKGVDHTPHTPP